MRYALAARPPPVELRPLAGQALLEAAATQPSACTDDGMNVAPRPGAGAGSRPVRVGRVVALVLRRLRRAGSVLFRLFYGEPVYEEVWTFPPESLRTAREALGLDADQAYELVKPSGTPSGISQLFEWVGLDDSREPIRCTNEKLAVLISTGMALRARAAGSDRGIAELILFGPAPLSHYPLISPVRPDRLDSSDFRRMVDAYLLLQTAQERLNYHDATIALRQRLANAVRELDSWVDS